MSAPVLKAYKCCEVDGRDENPGKNTIKISEDQLPGSLQHFDYIEYIIYIIGVYIYYKYFTLFMCCSV